MNQTPESVDSSEGWRCTYRWRLSELELASIVAIIFAIPPLTDRIIIRQPVLAI